MKKKEIAIVIDQKTQDIIEMYRRKQKIIPSKKEALRMLVQDGWKAYSTKVTSKAR